MHRVHRVALGSIHCLNSSTRGTDWATGLEALVVAVSFEVDLLSRWLCVVPGTAYSWVATGPCTIIYTCHEAQL